VAQLRREIGRRRTNSISAPLNPHSWEALRGRPQTQKNLLTAGRIGSRQKWPKAAREEGAGGGRGAGRFNASPQKG